MRAPTYLKLLCCIKIHPSTHIFNVSSRSFSVAEGCCRARRVSPGSCDHTVALLKAFCVFPRGAHSAYSCIITSKWLKKSTEYCRRRGHFPKPRIITVYIPVQLPCMRFGGHSTICSPPTTTSTNHKRICTPSTCCPGDLLGNGYWKCKTGVFAAFHGTLETGVRRLPSVTPTAFSFMRFNIGDNDWEQRVHNILHPEVQLANIACVPSWWFPRKHIRQHQTKYTWCFLFFHAIEILCYASKSKCKGSVW